MRGSGGVSPSRRWSGGRATSAGRILRFFQ